MYPLNYEAYFLYNMACFHRALAIEVCQIIHRAGLTQESIEALLLCADVLELVITAAKDHLRAAIADKTAGTTHIRNL